MKNLTTITLEENVLRNSIYLLQGIPLVRASNFFFSLHDGNGLVSAINHNKESWEHVMLNLEEMQRCATYTEMSKLKSIFWPDNEVALQVHPAKSQYINNFHYALHLWRYKSISEKAEKRLLQKITSTYKQITQKYYHGKKEEFFLSEPEKILVIFGGNSWPTWEEICELKQKYWHPEETAVQFNISHNIDLNKEHMIILWDATNFHLPESSLV